MVRRPESAGASGNAWRRRQPSIEAPFRMAVQRVVRPDQNFRGYAGQIASGIVRPGDEVIGAAFGPAHARRAHRDVRWRSGSGARADVGDADAGGRDRHQPRRYDRQRSPIRRRRATFEAAMVWFDGRPLDQSRDYLVKHTVAHGSGASRDSAASRERGHARDRAGRRDWR